VEKKARIADLLKSRSGIYHTANYQTEEAKAKRPARGSHTPGTFWYYNNWDFNVLGTILERQINASVFAEFKVKIASPIGMEDFRIGDGSYVGGPESIYPAYTFRMTARDMARFGLLFLRDGSWRGEQIVPREWIEESLTSYSDAGAAGGYGYMWWIAKNGRHLPRVNLPDGSFSARGNGGHKILVVPSLDLVVVHRGRTANRAREVTTRQFGELVRLILQAKMTGTTAGE
jgi:CubicO group peptidase (beta-lactamase class C family)